MTELIITNGDSAGEVLKQVYSDALVLPWRDVLHEGPVPLTNSRAELSKIRVAYLEGCGAQDAEIGFAERDGIMGDLLRFDRISLWFEHDLYDQLQLLQVLDALAQNPVPGADLVLVQADDYLGHYGPDDMGSWTAQAQLVSQAQLNLANKAWNAFRQDTPQAWFALLGEDLSALPFLRGGILRMLEELPDATNGLMRTQRHILETVSAGHTRLGRVFRASQECEEAKFMGDWSFFKLLNGMNALVTGQESLAFHPQMDEDAFQAYLQNELSLTPLGQSVLAGKENYTQHITVDFWWGGTRVNRDHLWCWDSVRQQLVSPL